MNEPLAEREIEILRLAADGYTNGEIAARLSLSLNTVKWYSRRIYEKLAVGSRTQAVQRAQALGLLAGNNQPAKPTQPFHNLPSPLTTFVGRRTEIDAVKQLLKQHRLLTLTGPGGIGKTRLALQVAAELAGFYPDGICFVDLSAINEAALVTNTIAHRLGVAEVPDTPLRTVIQTTLRDKQFLLILDNFEHLLAAAPLVADLLAAARLLTVLVTSREALALYGEQEYAVPPLTLPDLEWFATDHLTPRELLTSEALQLFERCAQTVDFNFRLTTENLATVASICLRLDGLPLAIELAAAYIKLFSPQVILTQLDTLWLEMKRQVRNIPARQQTLRNTIEWSYRFLNETERRLFAQLAVFRSGCTLEAITAICDHHSTVTLLEALNGLVNKSLLWYRTSSNGQTRFGMLETIREYAAGCLQADGDLEARRSRHAHYYAQYSKRLSAEIMSARQQQIRHEVSGEWDNLRAALRWSVEHDLEPGLHILHMISELASCWRIRDYLAEGMAWAEQLLTIPKPVSTLVQARAYASSAILAHMSGHRPQARQRAEQAYALSQDDEDQVTRALALHTWVITHIAPNLSAAAYEEIVLLCNETARLYALVQNQVGYGRVVNTLGEVQRIHQHYAEAKQSYEKSYQALHAVGYETGVALVLINLGWTLFHLSQYRQALAHFLTSTQRANELDFLYGVGMALIGAASALTRLNYLQPAARLLGVADSMMEAVGINRAPADEPDYERTCSELQAELGATDFAHYRQAGRHLTGADAIALVREYSG